MKRKVPLHPFLNEKKNSYDIDVVAVLNEKFFITLVRLYDGKKQFHILLTSICKIATATRAASAIICEIVRLSGMGDQLHFTLFTLFIQTNSYIELYYYMGS